MKDKFIKHIDIINTVGLFSLWMVLIFILLNLFFVKTSWGDSINVVDCKNRCVTKYQFCIDGCNITMSKINSTNEKDYCETDIGRSADILNSCLSLCSNEFMICQEEC